MVEEKKGGGGGGGEKEEARTVCVQRDKGWTHVICVHDTTHLAATTTVRGNWRSQRKKSCLVQHRDPHPLPPPSLAHRKWTIYLEKQKSKPREKTTTANGMNLSLAQPQTLTQGGHKITSLLN